MLNFKLTTTANFTRSNNSVIFRQTKWKINVVVENIFYKILNADQKFKVTTANFIGYNSDIFTVSELKLGVFLAETSAING